MSQNSLHKTVLILFIFVISSLTIFFSPGYGQFLPLPPPIDDEEPKLPPNFDKSKILKDKDDPIINLITSELEEGKNLFYVEIIDATPLKSRQLKYSYQGQIEIVNLVRHEENIYKALIYGTPPKNIMEISAMDFNENKSILEIELNVIESKNIFDMIYSWFKNLFLN